ncbi:hypothetical protein BJX99DRAFT_265276 [Aspergillus californicus]
MDSRLSSKGSDFELAYASPVVEPLKGGDKASDGRKRRHLASSDDSSTGWANFVNEDFRVGGPFLAPLPTRLQPVPQTHPLYDRLEAPGKVMSNIISIVVSHHVSFEVIGVVLKCSIYDPTTLYLTLDICAERTELDSAWSDAYIKIREYLNSQGLGSLMVEISDSAALKPPRLTPVRETEPIYAQWPQIRERILHDIELRDVRMVGCFRVGRNTDESDNPATVLVIVDPKSTREWKPTRELVVDILRQSNLPMVAVLVIKDNIRPLTITSVAGNMTPELFSGPAMIGHSIGPATPDGGSGTLGCFIELEEPKEGKWHTFALTCFHCVVPPTEQRAKLDTKAQKAIETFVKTGIGMYDSQANDLLLVNHPTGQDMKAKIVDLRKNIDEILDSPAFQRGSKAEKEGLLEMMHRAERHTYQENKAERASYKDLISTITDLGASKGNYLGYVAAASGIRQRDAISIHAPDHPSSLDWALVDVCKERIGHNYLGPRNDELLELPPAELRPRELNRRKLRIRGKSSGDTIGMGNGLDVAKIDETMAGGKTVTIITLEHVVLATYEGSDFIEAGDSGAVVCLQRSLMVGMLWGGSQALRFNFITHVDDLFNDIMKSTNAAGIRLPVYYD